jgi:hypothetical protein
MILGMGWMLDASNEALVGSLLQLFDHLISASKEAWGDRYAESFGRFRINHQLKPGREIDGKLAWARTF